MSTTVNPKREVFENLARIGTALSSAVRLDLLELLAQGERSVDELAALTGATVANASQHLQKLKQVGLIVGRKEAQFVKYRLAGDEVIALFNALGAAGHVQLAEDNHSHALAVFEQRAVLQAESAVHDRQEIAPRRFLDEHGSHVSLIAAAPGAGHGHPGPRHGGRTVKLGIQFVFQTW